jgi:hypothetical protein
MTMEQSNSNAKFKQKKSLSRYLLPNKIPNKVGVAVIRSQSARETRADHCDDTHCKRSMTISKRPLSLNVSNMSPKKENTNFLVSYTTFLQPVVHVLCFFLANQFAPRSLRQRL